MYVSSAVPAGHASPFDECTIVKCVPPAAELPAWCLLDGTELRGDDEYVEGQQGDPIPTSLGRTLAELSQAPSLTQRLRDAAASGAGVHGGGLYGMPEYWDERYALDGAPFDW